MKKIYLPHIFYTLNVIDVKKAKGTALEYLKRGYTACHLKIDKNSSAIYIKLPIKPTEVPTLCHELIHVLQHICSQRDIQFALEEEHCAYMYHYMLNEILGYEYF